MRIDLDHFETIEELERDLIAWIKEEDIYSFDRYLNKEDILKIVQLLIKKENIIEEVREYLRQKSTIVHIERTNDFALEVYLKEKDYNELLEILDKVGDEK